MTSRTLTPRSPADTGRIRFLDAAKGIGILVIAWGHMDYLWSPASIWFSSFKLAVFYIISGLLTGQRQHESWTAVAKKRIYSLLIPFVIFSILATAFHLQYSANSPETVRWILKSDFLLTVTLRGISTLWFLPTLYLGEVLFAAVNIRKRKKGTTAAILLLLPILLWGASEVFPRLQPTLSGSTVLACLGYVFLTVSKSFVAFWFICIGFLLHDYFFCRKPAKLWIVLCAIAANIGLSLLNTDVDLNFLVFGKYPLLFFPNGILGSVALLEILRILEKHCKLPVSSYCGKHALFIMATHLPWYICTRLQLAGMRIFTFTHRTIGYYGVCLICFAVMMLLEYILIAIKQYGKNKLSRHTDKYPFLRNTLKYL